MGKQCGVHFSTGAALEEAIQLYLQTSCRREVNAVYVEADGLHGGTEHLLTIRPGRPVVLGVYHSPHRYSIQPGR